MNQTTRGRLAALAFLGVLGLAFSPTAQGQEKGEGVKPSIRDQVGMFSADASKQALSVLESVHEKTNWQAVVETVESLNGKTATEAATANAKALRVHGVYVLIAKKETKVQVVASNTARSTFTTLAELEIVDAFVAGFKAKDFDRGLKDAVELIRKDAEAKPDKAGLAALRSSSASVASKNSGAKPGLRDGAGMFNADAAKQVDSALASIHDKTQWQVVIETVDTLGGKAPAEAALANAKALNVHGLYVLIAKKDAKVQVEASRTAKSTFTPESEKAIVAAFVSGFKAKEFDRGLADAVELIRKDAEAKPDQSKSVASTPAPLTVPKSLTPTGQPPSALANPPAPAPVAPWPSDTAKSLTPSAAKSPVAPAPLPEAQTEGGGTVLLIFGGLGIVLVLWAISKVFKRPQQADYGKPGAYGPNPNPAGYGPNPNRGMPPQGYPPQGGYGPGGSPPPGYGPGYGPPPQQGGGGGFVQGALGGLGGAIVGNILYDKFGRPHDPSNPSPEGFPHHGGGMLPPTQDANPGAWPGSPQPSESYDPNAGAGGDWGTPDAAPDQGAGGDWGTSDPAPDQGAGGDWGSADPQPESNGGDWGSADPGPAADQGGDWGGGGGGDDSATTGGDW